MSDKTLTKLATSADIKTVDSIKTQIPDWIWADEYGEDVLNLLKPIDSAWKAEIDAKAKENRARAKKPKTGEARHVEATGAPAPLHPAQVNAHISNPHVAPYAHSAPIFYHPPLQFYYTAAPQGNPHSQPFFGHYPPPFTFNPIMYRPSQNNVPQ